MAPFLRKAGQSGGLPEPEVPGLTQKPIGLIMTPAASMIRRRRTVSLEKIQLKVCLGLDLLVIFRVYCPVKMNDFPPETAC